MSRSTLLGAGALLAAPVLVVVATLVQPTLSDDAAVQVAALADHRGAAIAALALGTVAGALLVAGTIWLAAAVAPAARRLALAGGALGVLGMLVVLFEDGVDAAGPSIVGALDPAQATAALHRIESSAAVSALEPVTIVGCVGFALLAAAAARAGVARAAAAALFVGTCVETAGFATGTRALVVAGFAVLLAGAVAAARTLAAPGLGAPSGSALEAEASAA